MRLTNNLNLPEAIVRAVANDEYSRGDADFSVTQLLAPAKLVQLRVRHEDELTEDVSMRGPILVGQIGHGLFERAAKLDGLPGVLTEERFYISRTLPSGRVVRISGQMDHVLVDATEGSNELSDYKFPGIGSLHQKLRYGMEEWEQQVNLYALLLRENDIPIDRARIVAMGLGWMASFADRDSTYPQTQIIVIPVELWSAEQAEAFLLSRLLAHTEAEAAETEMLPDCTAAERWQTTTMYAVMKPGRKSAVRVVNTSAEAEIILNGNADWHIDTRFGVSKRCGRYCAAGRAGFCTQWNAERARLEAAGTSIPLADEADTALS